MTTKPRIRKHGNAWQVIIGDHLYASRATHDSAWDFAEKVATQARRYRFKKDLTRTTEAINRMEQR